jgi:hypothetical protein
MTQPTLITAFQNAMKRGVTYRRYPGGARPMYHRYANPAKCETTVGQLIAANVAAHNCLYRALVKRGKNG